MATREEWVRHFEDVNGCKPSPEEFMEAKKEGFVIASEEPSAQVSEQVEAQQVDSSETAEEVTADSVADTQPDEAQVALEEEAPKPMPELNMEKELLHQGHIGASGIGNENIGHDMKTFLVPPYRHLHLSDCPVYPLSVVRLLRTHL